MTFSLAVVLLAAVAVVALSLVVYNLLGRLHLLETAVQGGMQAPSRRLGREQFERQFAVAQRRAELAERFDTGVVLFVDHSEPSSAIVAMLRHLPRYELVNVVACDGESSSFLDTHDIAHIASSELGHPLSTFGVSTLPFCFVIDEAAVRAARHLGSPQDLIELLANVT